MTFIELVRKYFPEATDDECDFILWEKTPFPLCSAEVIEQRLQDMINES